MSRGQLLATAQAQNSVHHLSACGDDGAQFMAVDEFCCRGAVVAGQAGDLLDGDAVGRHQGDEGVAQVSRRPVCAEARRSASYRERR